MTKTAKPAAKKAAVKKRPARKAKAPGLPELQYNHWRVVDYWLKYGGHKYRAYMRFYPDACYKTARNRSGDLFQRPEVVAYVDEQRELLKTQSEIDRASMVQRFLALAEVDMRSIFDERGDLLPMHEWPPEITKTMVGVDSAGLPRFEGRKGALDSVARILGHFEADNKQRNPADALAELLGSLNDTTTPPGLRGE